MNEFTNSSYIVWLDIKLGADAFFEKEKRDIMNYIISKKPDNIVLSCNIIVDKKQSKLSLQFYLLQLGTGWKKLNKFFYSSLSDFNTLSSSERGEIGESLGKIFAKRLINDNYRMFFPEFERDFLRIEEGISFDFTKSLFGLYNIPDSHWELTNTVNSWEPDAIFQILTNPDSNELKYESFPKKIVYLEVKTGKHARFMRWQKNDTEALSYLSNHMVLFCHIIPEDTVNFESKLKLNFKILNKEGNWETMKLFYYSDF